MNVVIIDDEKNCRELIRKLIKLCCKDIAILGDAGNIEDAYTLIRQTLPDLVFLDIEMYNGNGFELLDKFEEINFQIIFTTAYEKHAATAIKYHVVDYLLKPLDHEEFSLAVEKARKLIANIPEQRSPLNEKKMDISAQLGLPVKDGIVFVNVSEIIRLESDAGYTTLYTTNQERYVVAKNLIEYENILPDTHFFRVHKSHIINLKKVKKFLRTDGNFIEMEGGVQVELSRRKKDDFLELMNLQT